MSTSASSNFAFLLTHAEALARLGMQAEQALTMESAASLSKSCEFGELPAQQVGCAVVTIKKIEADERRPSPQIAERLVAVLAIPSDERELFLQCVRGQISAIRLSIPPARSIDLRNLNTHRPICLLQPRPS